MLLVMGTVAAGIWIVSFLLGHKPDDALLVYGGSMFTTYALTEKSDDAAHGGALHPRRRRRDTDVPDDEDGGDG